MPGFPAPVLVMGAGSIGCYLGGMLAAAGADVTFVGRPRVLDALRVHGLTLTDLDGARHVIAPAALRLAQEIPAGIRPGLVLLAVKSGATRDAATTLAAALPAGTLVVSMQNGISNADTARAAAPALKVLAGMVPYNVAEVGPGHFHRGTNGELAAQDDAALRPWVAAFAQSGLPLVLHADFAPVAWGKLLVNLNNPVNALSGRPLREQIYERGYRICTAALIDETLVVLGAAGIRPAGIAKIPARGLPTALRLPTSIFRVISPEVRRIDPHARSSMADDLRLGRPTEINEICGAVVRLARDIGRAAPLNQRMVELLAEPAAVRPMSPEALQTALGLR
ncbi:MAG: 2-dehydropantoate 2-reductase [Proteobacteria bacterium]|nr:2-dehydropantoate 2-reductase [Pseudomonadota bacterium]